MGRRAEGWKLLKPKKSGHSYKVRFTHNGNRYDLSTGCKDSRSASKEAARIYAEVVSGRREQRVEGALVAAPDLTTLFAEWLATLDAELVPSTVKHYEMYVGVHYLGFFRSLADINAGTGTEYVQARLRKVTRRTVLKELSALRGFLRWCCDKGFIAEVPSIRSPSAKATGTRRFEHKAVHLDETTILNVIAHLPETTKGGGKPRAFYQFLWETGLRLGTGRRLLAKDVDYERGELRIRDEADKARYGRIVPLTPGALAVLRAVSPDAGLIFGARNHRYVLKKAAKAVGLNAEEVRHLSNHDFRRSRGTHWAENTNNIAGVSYLLGHKSVSTTDRYVKGREKAARAVLAACGSPEPTMLDDDSGAHSGAQAATAVIAQETPVAETSTQVPETTTEVKGLRKEGIEPSHCHQYGNLNPARLPIPPLPQVGAPY